MPDTELITMGYRFWTSLSGVDKWIIGTVIPAIGGLAGKFVWEVWKVLTNHAPHIQNSLQRLEDKQDKTIEVLQEQRVELASQTGYLKAIAEASIRRH